MTFSATVCLDQDGIGDIAGKCDISLLCNTCSEAFKTPWDLMVHAQAAHSMHIYEYKNDENEDDESRVTENIGVDTLLGTTNDNISTAINNYNIEVPHHHLHQPTTEQSFLPKSQAAAIIGNRSQ